MQLQMHSGSRKQLQTQERYMHLWTALGYF